MAEENLNENEEVDALDGEDIDAQDDFEVVVDMSDAEPEGVAAEAAEVADVPEVEAEPITPEVAATADEEDDDIAAMPEKVKKRFQREKRLRDSIIKERDQIRAAAQQVVQQVQQRDDEIVSLRRQYATVQKQYADTLDYAYEQSITNKAAELRKAREDGNYDAELKIQGELDALRFQQNQVRDAKRTLPNPESIKAPQRQVQQPAQQPAQQKTDDVPAKAIQWVEANKSWFNSPRFRAHRKFVLDVDQQLVEDGYDKNSTEYYAELDRRIDESFPTLRKRTKPAANGSARPPVAGVGATPRNTSKKTITLNAQDFGNMRRFGLDPQNKEHLRAYARSKRSDSAAA